MWSAAEPVLIKKYSNRRLYDTSQSRYITLEELAQIVQSGARVRVVDAKQEHDLTRQVLTQVILEQQERLDLLPLELLHGIIRVQGTVQQAPFAAWLQSVAQQLSSSAAPWAEQLGQLFGGFGFGAPGRQQQQQERSEPSPPPKPPPAAEPEPPPRTEPEPKDSPAARAELDDLRRRMDALLSRLGGQPKPDPE